jgi:hypothetical protein
LFFYSLSNILLGNPKALPCELKSNSFLSIGFSYAFEKQKECRDIIKTEVRAADVAQC